MPYTDRDIQEAKDILMQSGIDYWTRDAWLTDEGALVLIEDDDENPEKITISPVQLLDWLTTLTGPTDLIKQVGDPYQKMAIAMMMVRDWADLDYDVETGDLIVQQIALGEVRYG